MSVLTDLVERIRALLFRRREDLELDEELRDHLARETEARIRKGVPPDRARREAALVLGSVEQYKDAVRDARGIRPLDELAADLRFAVRGLRRNPGFTATSILVLALGLGATTAVYSIMHSVVLADLPYPEPGRLVMVMQQNSPTSLWNISTADATAIRQMQQSFSAWGEVSRIDAAVSGAGAPVRMRVGRGSAGFFEALEVVPARGRSFTPADEAPDRPPVLLATWSLADRMLGGPDRAVGRALTIDGVSHTVIGVLPPDRNDLAGFRALAWVPLRLPPPVRRGPFWMRGIGRLKPGVSVEQAAADLARISAAILPQWSDFRDSAAKLTPIPLRERIVGPAGRQVGIFAGAVALVLLLALTNVATLILVRASARRPEVALRVMLGAGRGRIARLLLTENLLLTLTAGLLGTFLAWGGIRLAMTELPALPRIEEAALDWRALVFVVTVALVSGLALSLSPLAALADGGRLGADPRRTGTGRGTNRLRALLVSAEFALALPLLAGAGLLLTSFVRLSRVDPGFDPERLIAAGVTLPRARYPDSLATERFWLQLEQQAASVPGVVAAGFVTDLPLENQGSTNNFNLVDRPVPLGGSEPASPWYAASPGYFAAMGIPVLEGRLFSPADTAVPVIVVSRTWAERYFPGSSPVGRELISGGCYDCPRTVILGVVGDIKNLGLAEESEAVYDLLNPQFTEAAHLVVRSTGGPAVQQAIRETIARIDPELPLEEATLVDRLSNSLADPRRWTAVLAAFALTGLGLAALGIFGLMSYVVRQRRREIGVRLALGAAPAAVTRLVVRRGVGHAVAGSAAGLIITLALVRRLDPLLFGVNPADLRTLGLVSALLLAVAVVACWIPGRRAARIRPVEVMNAE